MRPLILAVDDDPTSGKLIQLLCDRFGYQAYVVSTSADAKRALAEINDFAAVLMDLSMADESGIDCTRTIRELERASGRRIPIIAVTAHAFPEDKRKCLEAGMDDYLSKPYRSENLQELLEKWAGPGENGHHKRVQGLDLRHSEQEQRDIRQNDRDERQNERDRTLTERENRLSNP